MQKKRIYLDYAATTPLDPRVFAAMKPYFTGEFGNPGSLHYFGQKAMAAVDGARETISRALEVDFREVVFTGSATEANNLAIRGAVITFRASHPQVTPRIIVSAIEHESVLETARDLEKWGVEVIYLPVDKKGIVKLDALKKALNENTVLVSVMYVNNETGAVQPIAEIGKMVQEENQISRSARNDKILFHTDAAQAFQFFDCRPQTLGVDLMTLSAHKIYGPKGAGCLYVRGNEIPRQARDDNRFNPIVTGGGQEFGLRSGTENVAAIAGFGKAVELALGEREKNTKHIAGMKDRFLKGLKKVLRFAQDDKGKTAPHIANVWLPGQSAEDVLTRLDLGGIAVSAGSACRARSLQASYVLQAMGLSAKRAKESIRVSFGKMTTSAEVDATLKALKKILRKAQDDKS